MRLVVMAYQDIGYVCLDELLSLGANIAGVVTHRFPLERIADAFETIRSGTGLKMVILP